MIRVISKVNEATAVQPKDSAETQKPEESQKPPQDSQKSKQSQSSEKPNFKVGQIVTYKTKDGGEAEGEIKKIDGDTVTIYNKKVNQTFTKQISDIISIVTESYKNTILSYGQFISR